MATVKERERKAALLKHGFTAELLKDWQPKMILWRHKPGLNMNGTVTHPVGQMLTNQPTSEDHKLKMAINGFLPWKPGVDCTTLHPTSDGLAGCKSCREGPPEFTPVVIVDETASTIEVAKHTHMYRGKAIGSPCKTEGCMAERETEFKSRKSKK